MRLQLVQKRTIQIGQPRQRWISWLVYGIAVALFVGACTAPLWFGPTVRRLIPPRYIAAYAPEVLQKIIYADRNAKNGPLSAPVESSTEGGSSLLDTPVIPLSSSTPVIGGGQNPQSTSTQIPTPTATVTPTPIPPDYLLTGFTFSAQGWNNCGPATVTMLMSYWGLQTTQNQAADFLKGRIEDPNVNPPEIVDYVENLGYEMVYRVNGDIELLKRFVAAGYPVMIERGFDELPELHWMGHYMLIVGFSDQQGTFTTLDSYWGLHRARPDPSFPVDYWEYERLDELWRQFNRTYLVAYPLNRAAEVASIIGSDIDDQIMYANAAEQARTELLQDSGDQAGWLNLGSSLHALGDYQNAALAFDQAQNARPMDPTQNTENRLPRRLLWYQHDLYEAYLHTGRYDDVIKFAVWTLNWIDNPEAQPEEAWYYRGLAVQAQGNKNDARYFFNLAIGLNDRFQAAIQAKAQLDSGG